MVEHLLDLSNIEAPPASWRAPETFEFLQKGAGEEELKEVVSQFEGVFFRMLLRIMMPRNEQGLFGSGPSAGIVRGLFVDQVGEAMASRRALGIADFFESQLARKFASQGREPGPPPLEAGLVLKV